MRFVSEKPYFFTIMAFAPMPNRRAKPSRRLMPAGPGVPMRISAVMPRRRTSWIQAITGSVSKANWVRMTASRPCSSRAAILSSRWRHRMSSAMSGCPSGYPAMLTSFTPYCCRMPERMTDSESS